MHPLPHCSRNWWCYTRHILGTIVCRVTFLILCTVHPMTTFCHNSKTTSFLGYNGSHLVAAVYTIPRRGLFRENRVRRFKN